jgi:hypothetical protein
LLSADVKRLPILAERIAELKPQVKHVMNLLFATSSVRSRFEGCWEVSHCLLTDADGSILRYKVKDPSFHNWNGLAMALRDTGISDFPLNKKSYNLSYCGFDL